MNNNQGFISGETLVVVVLLLAFIGFKVYQNQNTKSESEELTPNPVMTKLASLQKEIEEINAELARKTNQIERHEELIKTATGDAPEELTNDVNYLKQIAEQQDAIVENKINLAMKKQSQTDREYFRRTLRTAFSSLQKNPVLIKMIKDESSQKTVSHIKYIKKGPGHYHKEIISQSEPLTKTQLKEELKDKEMKPKKTRTRRSSGKKGIMTVQLKEKNNG